MKRLRAGMEAVAPPLVLFALVLITWHAAAVIFAIPAYILPPPGAVARAALEGARALGGAMGLTAAAAGAGFVCSLLLGTAIALLFSQSALIRRSCFPYAIFLQTVPIVAIAPLIILIILTSGQLKTADLFAAVLACTVLGIAIFGLVSLAGDRILRSRYRDRITH